MGLLARERKEYAKLGGQKCGFPGRNGFCGGSGEYLTGMLTHELPTRIYHQHAYAGLRSPRFCLRQTVIKYLTQPFTKQIYDGRFWTLIMCMFSHLPRPFGQSLRYLRIFCNLLRNPVSVWPSGHIQRGNGDQSTDSAPQIFRQTLSTHGQWAPAFFLGL